MVRISASTHRRLYVSIVVMISICSVLAFLAFAAWIWILRDGLGPDSIESPGFEALLRFTADFWPIAAFWAFVSVMAFRFRPSQSSKLDPPDHGPGHA
jgi:hypothetical protein